MLWVFVLVQVYREETCDFYFSKDSSESMMIDATSKSVKWEEINSVNYRFQNLKFNQEVIEKLAAPISRRDWAMQQLMSHSNDIKNVFPTAQDKRRQRRQTTSFPIFAVDNDDTDEDLEEAEESVLRRRQAQGRAQSTANVQTVPHENGTNRNEPLRYDSKSSQFVPISHCKSSQFVPISHSKSSQFVPISHRDEIDKPGNGIRTDHNPNENPDKAPYHLHGDNMRTENTVDDEEICDVHTRLSPSPERQATASPPRILNKNNNYVTYKGPFRRILHRRNTDSNIVINTNGFSVIHETLTDHKMDEDEKLSGKTKDELISLVKELRSQMRAPRSCEECGATYNTQPL